MKNYTEFLTHKTDVSEKYGKIINELVPIIESKEKELEQLMAKLYFVQDEICNSIRPLYKNRSIYLEDIGISIEKARKYNSKK